LSSCPTATAAAGSGAFFDESRNLIGANIDLGGELGLRITEAGSGGGSDGNFTAALGVPTLDGLGVIGDGGHSEDEHVVLSSMPERAALLAALIRKGGPR
jgi:glutamate carboxypeptidase